MSGTHGLTSVPSLAREVCATCHIRKNLAQNDGVIIKIRCMHTCHHWHKCEINLKCHTEFANNPNLMINIINSACTHRCEVCEKNNRANTKINKVAELHLYHFLKINLSGFQRKQTVFLSKNLDKLSHDF